MQNSFIKLDDENYIKEVVYFEGEELEGYILVNEIEEYEPSVSPYVKYENGELWYDEKKHLQEQKTSSLSRKS